MMPFSTKQELLPLMEPFILLTVATFSLWIPDVSIFYGLEIKYMIVEYMKKFEGGSF